MLEETIEKWIKKHQKLLGFSNMHRTEHMSNYRKGWFPTYGDIIGLRDGVWHRIEVETESSGFFIHKPEVRKFIDTLICITKNKHRNPDQNEELATKEVIELWKIEEFREALASEELI